MIRKASDISTLQKHEPVLEVTATLLNQWQRIFDARDYVKESENDTISYEDKVAEAMKKAEEEFIMTLKRVKTPPTEAMLKGIEYENLVCSGGDVEFSPIIDGGEFQAAYQKPITVGGIRFMLYGILDVLKMGRIFDIKRVGRYTYPKYKKSHQHPMYFELVPNALDFTYLVCDDSNNHHYEQYLKCNCEDIRDVLYQFASWLKSRGLWETYVTYWDWSERSKRK